MWRAVVLSNCFRCSEPPEELTCQMMRAMVNPTSLPRCVGLGVNQTSERKAMTKKRAPKRQVME